ncbi:MAG: hypothetical protein LWW93_01840 [Hyphomicrobiales bacterium]|nr:hypothetical protein [Hyphomicrobiales bacterium]
MSRHETEAASDEFVRRPRDVLADAVDLFLLAPTHEKSEIRAFAALVGGLLDGVGAAERRAVSLALAARADTPPEIARRLATDSIEIAEAMIERSPVLTSSDLVEVMRRGPAHVRCVGRRLDLAPDVAAVLVDTSMASPETKPVIPAARRRGDREVEIVVPETLVEASPAPVATASIGPSSAPPLFRVPVREAAPARAATDPAPSEDTASGAALPDGFAFLALDSAGRWRALQTAALEVAFRPQPARETFADAALVGDRLLTAVVANDRAFFAEALDQRLGLGAELVEAMLSEASGEALAVALVACGVGEIRATSILLHHLGETATLGALQDLVALIERTARRTAERLVRAWRESDGARRTEVRRQTDAAERRETPGAAREFGRRESRRPDAASRSA